MFDNLGCFIDAEQGLKKFTFEHLVANRFEIDEWPLSQLVAKC